jgi:carbon-monoxide dehydrogenase medium subunit
MLPSSVDYYKASSVSDAVAKLKGNPEAKLLAGGHSLIPALKLRLNNPAMLIDISDISEMSGISESGGTITIGAMVTHGEIAKSAIIKEKVSILSETAELIGDTQVRNMGTIGGSLAHADPSADWPAALLVCNATIVTDQREIPVDEFFMGFFTTALEEEEVITAIKVPVPPAGSKMTYQKFFQPASRFAIVGCAALIKASDGRINEARVAFTGVSDGPFRDHSVEDALKGQPDSDISAEAAAKLAAEDVMINEDHYASEEYRKHLAKVYARKALRIVCGVVS